MREGNSEMEDDVDDEYWEASVGEGSQGAGEGKVRRELEGTAGEKDPGIECWTGDGKTRLGEGTWVVLGGFLAILLAAED
jgi:hypothetical protein